MRCVQYDVICYRDIMSYRIIHSITVQFLFAHLSCFSVYYTVLRYKKVPVVPKGTGTFVRYLLGTFVRRYLGTYLGR